MSETAFIQVPFHTPWRVRRNPLIRLMAEPYVDSFFEDGTIRISTFAEFKKHPDELRRDEKEGTGFALHNDREANNGEGFHVSGYITTGANAYVLCASMVCTPEMKEKYTPTGLVILDTVNFAAEISRQIPGCHSGLEGPCIYQERMIERNIPGLDLEYFKISRDSTIIDGDKVMATINQIAGDDFLFVKPMDYFAELEYRLVWLTSSPQVDKALTVKCPGARQYCERFKG